MNKDKAAGLVDYVNVKDWGGGKDVGDLVVNSTVSRVIHGEAYQDLVPRVTAFLQEASNKGWLLTESEQIQQQIPPFEKWVFKEDHYIQYLVDIQAIHNEMEDAVQAGVKMLSKKRADTALKYMKMLDPIRLGIHRSNHMNFDLNQLSNQKDRPLPSTHIRAYIDLMKSLAKDLHSSAPEIAEVCAVRYESCYFHF